ncbi:MAG TPA: hypothetical protein VGM41_17685 [Chitinophagaceae bacterium]
MLIHRYFMHLGRLVFMMVLLAAGCFLPAAVAAQADTVNPATHQLLVSALRPGLRQYLVYFQNPKTPKKLSYFWYWMRDISFEKSNNEKVIAIRQHWLGSDTNSYRSVYSLNSADDFEPLYHLESVSGKTNAYNWTAAAITGDDTVEGNARKGFRLDFTTPNFNWNLDIETFEMLPLAKGKSFAINFYDAGLEPPQYVVYTVTGSEIITTLNNEKVDCWKLYTEGKAPGGAVYSETYWISKKEHEFLKEEDAFNGGFRYKIKLPGATPDILKRFN